MLLRLALGAALLAGAAAGSSAVAETAPAVRVLNVQLPVDDLESVSRFYQDTVGMKEVLRLGSPTNEVVLGFGASVAEAQANRGARVQLIKYAAPPVIYDHSNMVLEVPDVAGLVVRITARGGSIVRAPREATISGRKHMLALVKDPAGNIFELISPP